jgi:hypothetical protein
MRRVAIVCRQWNLRTTCCRSRGVSWSPTRSAVADMADSKEMNQSLITAGMAWRVKYRKITADSLVVRMKLQIGDLGVHRKNRVCLYGSAFALLYDLPVAMAFAWYRASRL